MTRRGRIPYSQAEKQWLEENRMMVISDYHAEFVAAFGRKDVSAANLHSLRKRRGWKVGRDPGRYVGRGLIFSKAEMEWLRTNCTLPIIEYTRAFCAAFSKVVTGQQLHGMRKRNKWKTGRDGTFNKGSVPANKGKKMPFNANSAATRFKKGQRTGVAAEIYKPVGFERTHESGYRERKIHDGLPMQSRWKFVHRIEWEKVNGPVPAGMVLKCKGDKLDPDPSNWELVPRGLLPRLNGKSGRGYDAAPADLKSAIMSVAKLEHQLREKRRGNG